MEPQCLIPRLACFPSVSEQRFHLFWVIFGLIKGRGKGGRKNPTIQRRGKGARGRRERLSAAPPGTAKERGWGGLPGTARGAGEPPTPGLPRRGKAEPPAAAPRSLGMRSQGRPPSLPLRPPGPVRALRRGIPYSAGTSGLI